jgi:hypothetical protein
MEVDKNNIWHGTIKEALEHLLETHICLCDNAKGIIKAILKDLKEHE